MSRPSYWQDRQGSLNCNAQAIPAHVMRHAQLPGDHATAMQQKRQNKRRHYREDDRSEAPEPIRVKADHQRSALTSWPAMLRMSRGG
jgi:hypothetical protein